nr:MAG TPA: hypothetical protein [Microviridae sp.]
MPNEREKLLTMRQYKIAGNDLGAYYDNTGRLVFVLDQTITTDKPNVLLVIDAPDGRKWDDVLANDWHVDLETVRPKKNNKYQKLDIEYHALGAYNNLIRAYDEGADTEPALHMMENFRRASVRRSATERLGAAIAAADMARETIERTNDSIAELQSRLRELRSKLSLQKKSIGREPTKQSASKILRSESQIDATNEKLRRARRRLANAQRRLVAAEDDAQIARELLDRLGNNTVVANAHDVVTESVSPVVVASTYAPAVVVDAPLPQTVPAQHTEITVIQSTNQPKAEEMADEEVKPLFDKDPEILDEEIAFKPIEFDTPAVATESRVGSVAAPSSVVPEPEYVDVHSDAPLSFVPPTSLHSETPAPVSRLDDDFAPISNVPPVSSAPVLDSLTPAQPVVAPVAPVQTMPVDTPESRPAPVMPAVGGDGGRPVSPISGGVVPVSGSSSRQKPTMIYYLMLVVLIVLAIFTLWLYQKRNSDTVPELETTAPAPVVEQATPATITEDSPFIEPEQAVIEKVAQVDVLSKPEIQQPEPEPVAVEPEPISEPEPEPTVVEPAPVPVVAQPETTPEPEPVVIEPATKAIPSEEEIIASKPAYNVSQQEKMFVASPSYDTEFVSDVIETTAGTKDITEPTCDDGAAPDEYGCCAGEVYSDVGNGETACCNTSGECFTPLK